MSRKHSGKRRKYWLPAFSSFPTIFLKGFFFRVLKSWDCLVKGYCWKSGFAIGHSHIINPFPHIKILDQTKLKAFADDKLNVTKMIFSAFDMSRKHCGKRRNCLYKQFLLFPQCFQKASFLDGSKGVIVWEWVKSLPHNPDFQ